MEPKPSTIAFRSSSTALASSPSWAAIQAPYGMEWIGIAADAGYKGLLSGRNLRAEDVFRAYGPRDPIAQSVLADCIEFWGMAAANLISLLNPEVIVFGGGVFGPAAQFLEAVRNETEKWAQPIAFKDVRITASALGACSIDTTSSPLMGRARSLTANVTAAIALPVPRTARLSTITRCWRPNW